MVVLRTNLRCVTHMPQSFQSSQCLAGRSCSFTLFLRCPSKLSNASIPWRSFWGVDMQFPFSFWRCWTMCLLGMASCTFRGAIFYHSEGRLANHFFSMQEKGAVIQKNWHIAWPWYFAQPVEFSTVQRGTATNKMALLKIFQEMNAWELNITITRTWKQFSNKTQFVVHEWVIIRRYSCKSEQGDKKINLLLSWV